MAVRVRDTKIGPDGIDLDFGAGLPRNFGIETDDEGKVVIK